MSHKLLVFILHCFLSCHALAFNYINIQVYVPQQLVTDVYRALADLPGVKLKLMQSDETHLQRNQEGIGTDYYEDKEDLLPRKRVPRATSHGGYTSDQDTCQIYNHNLIKIWNKFSKYVIPGNHEVPSKMALHNIAQIVEAYLGHQDSYSDHDRDKNGSSNNDTEINDSEKDIDVDEIVDKVNKIVIDTIDEDTTIKIIDVIVNHVSTATQGKWDKKCGNRAKERLNTYISGTFQKFLENATCRRNINNNKKNYKIKDTRRDQITRKYREFDERRYLRQRQIDYETCEKNALDKFLHIIRLIIQNYINDIRC